MARVTDQARKSVSFGRDLASEAGTQATHTFQNVVRDGALATVGAGDQLVRQLRTLSDRLRNIDLRTEEGRQELEERLTHLRENAAAEFEQLVARGREVVDGLSHSEAAERASDQKGVAASQVKAAVTSLRKVAEVGAAQAAQTATVVRRTADASAQQADVAASQTKAAATSLGQAADQAGDVVAEAAERLGTETTDVPLEDLKFAELRELAKQRDVQGRTGMNKAELIRALRNA